MGELEEALRCSRCGEQKKLVKLDDGDGLIMHSCLGPKSGTKQEVEEVDCLPALKDEDSWDLRAQVSVRKQKL
jgi:hypothetical protein